LNGIEQHMRQLLLTSICRPIGERYGDGPSVGYELLHGQITRAQGLFGPRANHLQYSLEYIAENLDTPTTVLHYPSKRELIRELKKNYKYVGLPFVMATFHRMKEVVALVREHAPSSEIILGGYGSVLSDEILEPYADHICRGEGVAFLRQLLGEPEISMPYRHPTIISRLRVFGREVSRTGMVFAGLGCPNGCDFCCTSHFFKRKHIKLLPTGRDIYRVIERYDDIEPGMSITILDEDFLLNRKRALEFRDCVQEAGRPISVFAFASVRALSLYSISEILEMGIDGFWIGYEGTRSGFGKQKGRPVDELFGELREHGISVLASMIVGFPYQTPEIIEEELAGLIALKPSYTQFLIYGPMFGTPFYKRVMDENLMHSDLADDREHYFRNCTGFTSMVKHPVMSPEQIEAAQKHCFQEDFERLGPSIFRSIETWHLGYLKLKDDPNPYFRQKADYFAKKIKGVYPVFLSGKLLGPTAEVRQGIAQLQDRIHQSFGKPSLREKVESVAALGLASWTGFTLKFDLFQHPKLTRHTYRSTEESLPARAWRCLKSVDSTDFQVSVELRPESTVWVRVEGRLLVEDIGKLAADLRAALKDTEDNLVLDLAHLVKTKKDIVEGFGNELREFYDRVRVVFPRTGELSSLDGMLATYN